MTDLHCLCPHCQHGIHVKGSLHGHARLVCPGCQKPFAIRQTSVSPLAGSPVPAPAAPQPLSAPVQKQASVSLSRVLLLAVLPIGLVVIALAAGVFGLLELRPGKGAQRPPAEAASANGATSSVESPDGGPAAPEPLWLPADKQARVSEAIQRGVSCLRQRQSPAGIWAGPNDPLGREFPTSMAALPALVLLECGIPADDPQLRKAVKVVREAVPHLHRTYDLALAVLLLDHLQEPEDRPRIRSMTLRLVAGQQKNGGWSYGCPVLAPKEEQALWTALEKSRPASPLDLFRQGTKELELGLFLRVPSAGDARSRGPTQLERFIPAPPERTGHGDRERFSELTSPEHKKLLESLPERIRLVPSLHGDGQFAADHGNADNSNTQFAILALLTAERYQMPLERTLGLVVQRFHATQRADGYWTYNHPRSTPRPSMTGAGLLGLAVKYGLVLNDSRSDGRAITIRDAAIDKGLQALSEYVGRPLLWGRPDSREGEDRLNLYAMWSIERVGALYHLRRINGKEWYPWGVDQLLPRQRSDGSWHVIEYWHGTSVTDTCFALLFLRRADFARDLSRKLEFFSEGPSLDAR